MFFALLRHALALPPPQESDEYEVRLVQVLFRHGARTPISHTSDPQEFESLWGECRDPANLTTTRKCRNGDLTPLGEAQLLKLGSLFRERFVNTGFLNPALDPSQLLATSTPAPRTILSCKLVLKGLFPQIDVTQIQTAEDMTPFSSSTVPPASPSDGKLKIYVQPWERTFIFGNYLSNSRLRELYHQGKAAVHDEGKEQRLKEHAAAVGVAESHPLPSWIFLADEIHCRHGHGLPQKSQLSEEMQSEALHHARRELLSVQHEFSPETLQLGVKPFINQLMMRIASTVRQENPDLKCVLYSGHDTSVAPLRAAFGFHDDRWPPYASFLMWELLQKKSSQKPTLLSVLSPSSPSPSSSLSPFSVENLISEDPRNEWAVRVTWNGEDYITVPLKSLQQRLLDHGFIGPEAKEPAPLNVPHFEWGLAHRADPSS